MSSKFTLDDEFGTPSKIPVGPFLGILGRVDFKIAVVQPLGLLHRTQLHRQRGDGGGLGSARPSSAVHHPQHTFVLAFPRPCILRGSSSPPSSRVGQGQSG